ncbi:DUS2 phosphatase, partial [Atractosteus spatula]|nr:DUS2 phosphatase [Atractosteus spatula]
MSASCGQGSWQGGLAPEQRTGGFLGGARDWTRTALDTAAEAGFPRSLQEQGTDEGRWGDESSPVTRLFCFPRPRGPRAGARASLRRALVRAPERQWPAQDSNPGHFNSVKESGGRVLVHCQAGISRSATICLAYLIVSRRVRLDEAFAFVKQRRGVISPNLSFMGQLLQFETDVLCH